MRLLPRALVGYGPPCPPHGETHRYRFTLYALDAPLHVQACATRQHVFTQAQLVSMYKRQR